VITYASSSITTSLTNSPQRALAKDDYPTSERLLAVAFDPVTGFFPVIKEHRNKWDIRFLSLVVKDRLGIRAISHYFKMLLKIREIKRVFTHQEI
jgi:hypothetical protein